MQYAFARSDNRLGMKHQSRSYLPQLIKPIERPDFDRANRDGCFFGSTAANFMKHAPWLNAIFQSLPDQLTRLAHPLLAAFLAQRRVHLPHHLPILFPKR